MKKILLFLVFGMLVAGCVQQQAPPAASQSPTFAASVAELPSPAPPEIVANTPMPSASATPTVEAKKPDFAVNWSKDEGTRVADGSVPFAFKMKDGRIRLYYCGPGGILSAISQDSLTFNKEEGVRFNSNQGSTCDPSVVSLPDGRFRMYYKIAFGQGGPGSAVHKIYSAVSSDGLTFQDEGLRIDSEKTGDNGWASVPEAVLLEDGGVRIYYVSGDFEARGGTMSAVSADGLAFDKEAGARTEALVDPAVLHLSDGAFLLLGVSLPTPPGLEQKLPQGIYALFSKDGLNFGEPRSVLQENGVYDPSIIQVDEDTFRVYYGKDGGSPGNPNIVTKSITGKKQ